MKKVFFPLLFTAIALLTPPGIVRQIADVLIILSSGYGLYQVWEAQP